jgi:predicted nucleotidyltransferase
MWNIYGLSTMAKLQFPVDLREFLKLLNSARVEYLLIGGYAVAYYGYPRATADLDIWVNVSDTNARKLVRILRNFGFDVAELTEELFLKSDRIVRFGEAPLRIEILTTISGVSFDDCFRRRARVRFDGLQINLISLPDLKKNKAASGRPKDLDDLQRLEE